MVQVAHGLILRAFVKRWLGYPVDFPMSIMMSPGAISILRSVHARTISLIDVANVHTQLQEP